MQPTQKPSPATKNPTMKFGACLPTFASCADRYCLSGYGGGASTVEGMLDLATTVPDLSGIELVGNWHINDENIERMKQEVARRKLTICMLTPDLWTQAKWGKGSLAAADAATRRAAVAETTKVMDWAAAVGCAFVDVWPGQDGYDYLFQADYQKQWEWMVAGVRACADHRPDVQVLIEYKPKEPRTHIGIGTVGKALLLIEEVNRPNVGVLLDTGHAAEAYENPAESVALLGRRRQLAYMHFNDNWHAWDDDMLVGSIHIPELLETIYWLKRIGYNGWYTLDIFPYREDGVKAASESIAWIKGAAELIDRIGMDRIGGIIERGDATEASALMREIVLK
ncbi:MAG: sugar phosphate isomerase/epimerase [Opitutaceae bacterium]|nr:sugar phosphate isomerase/epimerase [Opitutaceae bacterium]